MNQIEFHEDNEYHMRARKLGYPDTPMMQRFLIDRGIVKNTKQAQYLLLGVSVFLFIVAIFFYFNLLKGPQIDHVITSDGQKIEVEEFIEMLGRGEDPLI